jgi:hypothetical protein
MWHQMAKYGVGLIALYLIVANASGFGKDLAQAGTSLAQVTKTLQGR